jgi:hypothetical protein
MARSIFAGANQPKTFYAVPGAGHNDLPTAGGAELEEVLRKFVQARR